MCVNPVKQMIRKFESAGSLDTEPGSRQRTTQPPIVEEVEIKTAEATARSSNATVSNRSIALPLDIPWVTERMILRRILKIYPYKLCI